MMEPELVCARDPADYVLGRLEEPEQLAFQLHMAHCEACRAEVDLLESAAVALPMMVPRQSVPGFLRHPSGSDGNLPRPAPGRRPVTAPARTPKRERLSRPVPRSALVAVGALLAISVLIVFLTAGPASQRLIRARAEWTPGGALIELSGQHGQLLAEGMPDPPAGDVYAIWIVRGRGALKPTGALFAPTEGGDVEVEIPGRLRAGDFVVVTPKSIHSSAPMAPAMVIAEIR